MTSLEKNEGSHAVIDGLLKRLGRSTLKDRIKVFGSVARGSENPRDLDIWVDMTDQELNFAPDREVSVLLTLARAFPSYLDAFVQYKNTTIVRNAECSDWVGAKFARKIRARAEEEGLPLDAVLVSRGLIKPPVAFPKP